MDIESVGDNLNPGNFVRLPKIQSVLDRRFTAAHEEITHEAILALEDPYMIGLMVKQGCENNPLGYPMSRKVPHLI